MTNKKENRGRPREESDEKLSPAYPTRLSKTTFSLIEDMRRIGVNPPDLIRTTLDKYLPIVVEDFLRDLSKKLKEHDTNSPPPKP